MQNMLCRLFVCWSCLTLLGAADSHAQATTPASPSAADDTFSVRLASGRTFTAALDTRTDADRLWLRFQQAGIAVLRPIDWGSVVSAEVAGQNLPGSEFQRLVEQLRQEMPAEPTGSVASMNIEMIGVPDAVQANDVHASAPPVETPRVISLEIDVRVGRWDEKSEPDGLVVRVYPLDADRNVVPVRATLRVDLELAPRCKNSLRQSLVNAGRWSELLRTADFGPAGAVYRLPFQSIRPGSEEHWLSPGLVHASLAVPGHGTFEASCYVPLNARHFRTM